MENTPILQVQNLKKYFTVTTDFFGRPSAYLKAVDDVSFFIRQGETLGLVGESGCGKSTLGRTIIHLYKPTDGTVFFNGQEIKTQQQQQLLRSTMQMIFQDPYASLNPRMTAGDIIGEPLDIHHLASGRDRMETVARLLQMVGLNQEQANRFPHEFSGGQRQRIGIARALAVNPSFIICDEPISALDVSIQAQIVNLLERLQAELGLTYLFIAHDLAMVKHISDRVAVMYMGKIVEIADSTGLYSHPQHPYTQALLSAIPLPDPAAENKRKRIHLTGDAAGSLAILPGCKFRSRCSAAMPMCEKEQPALIDTGAGHMTACHLIKQ